MANAWEIPGGQFSLDVADSMSPIYSEKPAGLDNPCMVAHRFAKVNTDGAAEYATAVADSIVGVTYTEAPVGAPISIAGCGIVMIEASGTIAAGDGVVPSADGKAAKGSDKTIGIALTGGSANSLVTVLLK